jgi:hypothetical protein
MTPSATLAFAGTTHEDLRDHLFPGDGLEAAALLLCTRTPPPRLRLLVRDVLKVPYSECVRHRDEINWPGEYLESAIDIAARERLTIVAIHSHPSGALAFSALDDVSDLTVVRSLIEGYQREHGSAVMTADGAIRARLYSPDMRHAPIDLITVAGHDIAYWWDSASSKNLAASARPLPFTSAMKDELSRLSACVIGVSGTGSIVAEQLSRLGFGKVYLIDFDKVLYRNLNRILNSSIQDAQAQAFKVDAFARAIRSYRGEGVAEPVAESILTREAVLAASQSDVLFSCVDSLEARHLADLLASTFLLPLVDVGVTIPVRNHQGSMSIADVCGRVDYIQPGRSTLSDRGVYSPASLRAEYLVRVDPQSFAQERDAGYIKGLHEEAPSVITLNMRAGAAAVNEFIARAYPFRIHANEQFARTIFSLKACEEDYVAERDFIATRTHVIARGDLEPLLGIPALQSSKP